MLFQWRYLNRNLKIIVNEQKMEKEFLGRENSKYQGVF